MAKWVDGCFGCWVNRWLLILTSGFLVSGIYG